MGELNLKGKVAVVTGASQGLGEALAIRLDKEGCKVAVCDFNIEGAKSVAAKLKDAIAIPVDVTNYEQCEAMAKTVLDKWGQVDILVSNAGIVKSGDIYNLTPAMFAAVTNVNLNGYFNVVKAFAPSMLERKSGSIIQLNSTLGQTGMQIENITRICLTSWRTTKQQGHGAVCSSVLRKVIIHAEAVTTMTILVLLEHKILCNRAACIRCKVLQRC